MKYKYVVIGAGAGGLVVAIGLAKAKRKVLLIEKNLFGGDCTNFGCIPSKTLIASSKIIHLVKKSKEFGIDLDIKNIDTTDVLKRVRDKIEKVRSKEDEKALSEIGIDVLKAKASFLNENTIVAEDLRGNKTEIFAKKIILATGSTPNILKIEGLDKTPYHTNETIFNLEKTPKSLTIIGAGAIGCELAQAFQMLGSKVNLIDISSNILINEEVQASNLLKEIFLNEKISLHLNTSIEKINYDNSNFEIFLKDKTIKSEQLLLAVGRTPAIEELNLKKANIKHSKNKIFIDCYGRTNKKHIFAIGDAVGPPYFTHVAEHMARSVLTTLLIPFIKKKFSIANLPRVTFTTPEIASIGLSEENAIKKYTKKHIATYFVDLSEDDRALCEEEKKGFVKIVTLKWSSKILGATIVANRAGEMLSEIYLSMNKNIKLRSLSNIIHPYPTYNLAIRKAADKYLTETLLKAKK